MKLPQLTLRDLFWLVLVCALAVGWWADSRRYPSSKVLWETLLHHVGNEGELKWENEVLKAKLEGRPTPKRPTYMIDPISKEWVLMPD